MIDIINLLIALIFECLIFVYYTNSIFYPRNSYLLSNLGALLGYVILYSISLAYIPIMNVVAFTVVNFAVIYGCFKIKLRNAILQALTLTAIMMFAEGILGLILNAGIYNNAQLDASFSVRITHAVLSKMIYFIGIVVATYVSKLLSKGKNKYGTAEGHLRLICIPIFTIMFLLGIMSVFMYINEQQRIVFALISVFGVASNIIVYWMYDKIIIYNKEIQELQEQKFKNNLELAYCNMLEDKLSQTKVMRHDFREHLKVLEAYISNDNSAAMEYLKSIEIKNDEVSIVNYTNNKVLNILFAKKQKICINKGIEFKIHTSDVSFDFMKDIDIVSIFSNLLNNAIENSENSEKKIIYVNLYKMNKSFLIVKIENSCDKKPIEDNGFYKTTKISGGEHGIGLKSVARALKNYNGDLKLQYNNDEKMFSAMIMIQL